MHEDPLCEAATVRFWLDEKDESCIHQMLYDKGEWNPSPGESEDDHLQLIGLGRGGDLMPEWRHSIMHDNDLRAKAHFVIDARDKTKDHILHEAMTHLRVAFGNAGY